MYFQIQYSNSKANYREYSGLKFQSPLLTNGLPINNLQRISFAKLLIRKKMSMFGVDLTFNGLDGF
jgi:hypothetical protein